MFFGMTILYGISGIALNHFTARHWDPGIISRSESFTYPESLTRSEVTRQVIEEILSMTGEKRNYKQYYFPNPDHLMVYLRGGHIYLTLSTGEMELIRVRSRPFFREINYLHYNKPRKLWTWFSDLYAFSLILIAVSGLLLVKGRKGISGRGGLLAGIGILIPLIFLLIYLWL